MVQQRGADAVMLTGDMSKTGRIKAVEKIRGGTSSILIATAQLIAEGFDLPSIDRIHLVIPMKYHGKIIQAVGRILRVKDGKDKAVIHDYVDHRVGVLLNSFKYRMYAYSKMGVNIPALPFSTERTCYM